MSADSLTAVCLPGGANEDDFSSWNAPADFLEDKNWINKLIFWELELLKLVGYDLELKKITKEEIIDNKKFYFVSNSNEKKYIPSFLVEKNNDIVDFDQIFIGLKLISDYLDKSILRPNNISHPKPRIDFLNLIKE